MKKSNKVLIVEPDLTHGKKLQEILRSFGVSYIISDEGLLASRKLMLDHEGEIGCLIFDVGLPKYDEVEFLLWVKNFCKKTSMIMLADEIANEKRYFKFGVNMIVQKPVCEKDVRRALEIPSPSTNNLLLPGFKERATL